MSEILSLDITEDLITWLVLETSPKHLAIKRYGVLPTDHLPLAEILPDIAATMASATGEQRIAIEGDRCFFRNLTVPFADRKKIAQILPYELHELTLADPAELHLDFLTTPDSNNHTLVLAAMVNRSDFAERLAHLQAHGIDPAVISLGGVATALELAAEGTTPNTFLLLDIGLRQTMVTAVRDGRIVLLRALATDPGNQAGWRIAPQSAKLTAEQPDLVEQTSQQLCLAIRQTLLAARDEVLPGKVYPIYIDGPLAAAPEVTDILKAGLDQEIRHFDLRQQTLQGDESTHATDWHPCLMNRVLALARCRPKNGVLLNFRSGAFHKKRSFQEYRRFLPLAAITLSCLIVVTAGLAWYNLHTLRQKNSAVQQQIETIFKATLPSATRIVNPLQQLRVELQETKRTIRAGNQNRTGMRILDILAEISNRIPPQLEVRITRLVADPSSVRLKGTTPDFNTVDRMQKALQNSPLFGNTTITSANLAPKGEEVRFELKLDFKEE